MLVLEHPAVGPAHIAIGNLLQRDRHRLDDEIVHRELVERLLVLVGRRLLVDLLACGQQFADVAIDRQIEMRDGLHRGGQALRDRAPHAVMRHDLVGALLEQRPDLLIRHRRRKRRPARRRSRRRLQALAGFRLVDVARDDAAMRPGADDAGNLDAGLLGQTPRQRR